MAKQKIMVVEDSIVVSRDIQARLANLGYGVAATAVTGQEAIDRAEETRPDLILMDINLKGPMDGVEATEHIHQRLDIPIVYLTAQSDEGTLKRAKLTGPFGYLLKPFDERDLHTTIEIALYKHESQIKLQDESDQNLTLFEVARILAQNWSFEEKCKGILLALTRLGEADVATLRTLDDTGQSLSLISSAGTAGLSRPELLSIEQSLAGKAFKQRQYQVANDYPANPNADPGAVAQGFKSVVCLPVISGGQILGIVSVMSQKPDHFTPRIVRVLNAIAAGLGNL